MPGNLTATRPWGPCACGCGSYINPGALFKISQGDFYIIGHVPGPSVASGGAAGGYPGITAPAPGVSRGLARQQRAPLGHRRSSNQAAGASASITTEANL